MGHPAASGPYGKGALPEGSYTASGLQKTQQKGMVDPNGLGWKVILKPNFPTTDNRPFRIHPDEQPPWGAPGTAYGTAGCVGIEGDTRQLYDALTQYFEQNTYFILDVEY